MRHEKFEAKFKPTPDGFENYYDSLQHTACHEDCCKLSVGFQLLREVGKHFASKLCVVNKKQPYSR